MKENSNNPEIVDFSSTVKEFFIGIFLGIYKISEFYKRKIFLFLGIIIIGVIVGLVWDFQSNSQKKYVQEVIIETNFNSRKYIYNYIENFQKFSKDSAFMKKRGFSSREMSNIRSIEIEPIIQITDILEKLRNEYDDQEYIANIISSYSQKELSEERYLNFYRLHKIIIEFNVNSEQAYAFVNTLFSDIQSNAYYETNKSIIQDLQKESLESSKSSIRFIDSYLEKIIANDNLPNSQSVVNFIS